MNNLIKNLCYLAALPENLPQHIHQEFVDLVHGDKDVEIDEDAIHVVDESETHHGVVKVIRNFNEIRHTTFIYKDILDKPHKDVKKGYTVYCHDFTVDGVDLSYYGITKRHWIVRLREHFSSPYLLGEQLRGASGWIISKVVHAGLSYENAMKFEEDYVGNHTLYPKGLNIIPGGFAGIRHLHKLTGKSVNFKNREVVLNEFLARKKVTSESLGWGIPLPMRLGSAVMGTG